MQKVGTQQNWLESVLSKNKKLKKWVKMTPSRRMASPDEIADAVMFIIGNDFLCGRTIEVDGGLRM